jgi:predicted nucleic acid-binding protein
MMNNFKEIKKNFPIIIDTCIFMVGIDKRQTNPDYSLEKMKTLWLNDVLSYFDKIYLHEIVYKELDDETRVIIDGYTDKNIEIVSDKDLFDSDPEYMRIYNKINRHPLMYAPYSKTKNQGEIHSLAYACFYNISFFSSRDSDACDVCNEIEDLQNIKVIGFETLLGIAYNTTLEKEKRKGLKALYKEFCKPKIKQGVIPSTLSEFLGIKESSPE